MFRYDTLREQWLIVVLFGGIALILYFTAFYVDLNKPRKIKKGTNEYERNYLSVWQGIPWSIKITGTVIILFMAFYLVYHIIYPKSW